MIENRQTGERIEFLREDDDVLEWEAAWTRTGPRAVPHVHPKMDETWEVLSGSVVVRIDGVEHHLAGGETAVAPAGCVHEAWNAGPNTARVRVQMRPPGRWRSFTERLFRGDDVVQLLQEYGDEVTLPPA